MAKLIYEHPEDTASKLIEDDYLNEYLTFDRLLYDKDSKYKKSPLAPRSFFQRYPEMKYNNYQFKVSEVEKQKIEKLDKLSAEANRLLNEPNLDEKGLMVIVIKVADICGRPDFANKFRRVAEE